MCMGWGPTCAVPALVKAGTEAVLQVWLSQMVSEALFMRNFFPGCPLKAFAPDKGCSHSTGVLAYLGWQDPRSCQTPRRELHLLPALHVPPGAWSVLRI